MPLFFREALHARGARREPVVVVEVAQQLGNFSARRQFGNPGGVLQLRRVQSAHRPVSDQPFACDLTGFSNDVFVHHALLTICFPSSPRSLPAVFDRGKNQQQIQQRLKLRWRKFFSQHTVADAVEEAHRILHSHAAPDQGSQFLVSADRSRSSTSSRR